MVRKGRCTRKAAGDPAGGLCCFTWNSTKLPAPNYARPSVSNMVEARASRLSLPAHTTNWKA